MSGLVYLLGLCLVFLVGNVYAVIVARGQIINAFSFFSLELVVKVLLSTAVLSLVVGEAPSQSPELVARVLGMTLIFLLGAMAGYCLKGPARQVVRRSKIFFSVTPKRWRLGRNLPAVASVFLALAVACFILLAWSGGGGMLWVTDPRYAYQHYRGGAGPFYVFGQFFLYCSFASVLFWTRGRRGALAKVVAVTLGYSMLAYFLGSKRGMVTMWLMTIVFQSYFIRRIRVSGMVIYGLVLTVVFLTLQAAYSGYGLISAVGFFDYTDNMVRFFEMNPQFSFMRGGALWSNLWSIVPRSLYPAKPDVYGLGYITEMVYPGAAGRGHFLGVLPWTLFYLDFGMLGVAAGGVATGLVLRYFQLLMESSGNLVVFLLFVNYAISPVLKHVPGFTLMVLVFITLVLLRVRFSRRVGVRQHPFENRGRGRGIVF